jgi:hypothetical protein
MRTILLTAFIALCSTLSTAQPVTITVEGVGFVTGDNTAAARDMAIADARLRAVEQAFGVAVDARTALHKSLLIDDTMLTRTQGAVIQIRILEEGMDEHGLYRVKLEANVDQDTMREELFAVAGEKRVLIVSPIEKGSESGGNRILLERLAKTFAATGFQLRHMAMNPTAFLTVDESGIINLAQENGSDLIAAFRLDATTPQCPVANYCAALAMGRVRLYDGKNRFPGHGCRDRPGTATGVWSRCVNGPP